MGPRLEGLFYRGKDGVATKKVYLIQNQTQPGLLWWVLFVLSHGAFLRPQSKGERPPVVSGFLLLSLRTDGSY